MVRKQFAALAATLFIAGTLGSTGAQAVERELAATVIVACDHGGRTELTTRVSGVETAGRVAANLAAVLQAGSCAEAFNLLASRGFELIHRLAGTSDVDGRDFLVWQRGGSPAPALPPGRGTTVLLSCEYVVVVPDRLVTRVVGSEIAGAVDASLGAALATRPSCAEAFAALAGARFGLVSAAPTPSEGESDGRDFLIWQRRF